MCHWRICFWIFEQCILTTVGGRYVLHHQETHESTRKIWVYRFTRHHGCYFTQCILWASKIFQIMWNGFDSLVIGVLFGWNSLKFICSVCFTYHQDETIQLHPTIQKMVGSNTSPTTFHHLVLHQGLIGLMRCRLPWTGWRQRVCHGSECSLEWFVVLGSTGVDGT